MSGGHDIMQLRQDDLLKFLACKVHTGAKNIDFQMESYVSRRGVDGTYIINLKKTWEKLLLAARAIAAVEHPGDVCVISARPYSQRAILKYATHTGATPVAGRFTPGTFTNQIQAAFREPRLLIVCDPRTDHQALTEASYVNIPVIAFCNTDSPLKLVDIAIPSNNKGKEAIGLMWWMLAREVLILRGVLSRNTDFQVDGKTIMVDLYIYRDPEDVEKETKAEKKEEIAYQTEDRWGQELAPAPTGQAGAPAWTEEGEAPTTMPMTGFTAPIVANWADETAQQWTAQHGGQVAPQPAVSDWGAGGHSWGNA
jgi:small subunit ribosomal protein SAe